MSVNVIQAGQSIQAFRSAKTASQMAATAAAVEARQAVIQRGLNAEGSQSIGQAAMGGRGLKVDVAI